MSILNITPYVHFNGNADQAIAHYQTALSAQVEQLIRFRDMPGMEFEPAQAERLMHCQLRIGGQLLFVSDSMPHKPVSSGGHMQVCLNFDEVADMSRKFAALAVGGQVSFPLQETAWSAAFGMLTDAFGIDWMFNCEKKP
ncbi:MAG: hypothetical protein JWN48_1985 [Myxococcaceae bacterium]|nr:hypothetical protein [Myxococcaceae bacterium]